MADPTGNNATPNAGANAAPNAGPNTGGNPGANPGASAGPTAGAAAGASPGAPADSAPDPGSVVNPQIIDAVRQSTGFAFGLQNQLQAPVAGGTRLSSGAAVAYEKAAQAAAFAVQDATDYQRNVMSVSNIAQGKALAMMFADKQNIPQYAQILVLAIAASLAATVTAGEVGAQATKMLAAFPRA